MCRKRPLRPYKLALPFLNRNPTKVTSTFRARSHIPRQTRALQNGRPSGSISTSQSYLSKPKPSSRALLSTGYRAMCGVEFLIASPIIDVYLCISYFRIPMWQVITSSASIGRASPNRWLCKVKCSLHHTVTTARPITTRHTTIPLPHHL
jgi:hypothetical protein